jgi:hypothetical protein
VERPGGIEGRGAFLARAGIGDELRPVEACRGAVPGDAGVGGEIGGAVGLGQGGEEGSGFGEVGAGLRLHLLLVRSEGCAIRSGKPEAGLLGREGGGEGLREGGFARLRSVIGHQLPTAKIASEAGAAFRA